MKNYLLFDKEGKQVGGLVTQNYAVALAEKRPELVALEVQPITELKRVNTKPKATTKTEEKPSTKESKK